MKGVDEGRMGHQWLMMHFLPICLGNLTMLLATFTMQSDPFHHAVWPESMLCQGCCQWTMSHQRPRERGMSHQRDCWTSLSNFTMLLETLWLLSLSSFLLIVLEGRGHYHKWLFFCLFFLDTCSLPVFQTLEILISWDIAVSLILADFLTPVALWTLKTVTYVLKNPALSNESMFIIDYVHINYIELIFRGTVSWEQSRFYMKGFCDGEQHSVPRTTKW